jgi:hypothetical protein
MGWQMTEGFAPAEQAALHMDLLTDRLTTENFQRFRSATLLLFLSDVPAEPEASAAGSSSSSVGWSLVFPWARGGSWRGSTQPGEHLKLIEAGKQVCAVLSKTANTTAAPICRLAVLQLRIVKCCYRMLQAIMCFNSL